MPFLPRSPGKAPDVPHDNLNGKPYPSVSQKTLQGPIYSLDGEQCDKRRCPAHARVLTRHYGRGVDGHGVGPRLGHLHWCAHHYNEIELEIEARVASRHCVILVDNR